MSYKRLTMRKDGEIDTNCKNCKQCNKVGRKYICNDMTACDEEIINRLAELEDKIENGTLIELPCMIQNNDGEWLVYFFNTMFYEIDYYEYDDIDKEYAEATLKELKGEV